MADVFISVSSQDFALFISTSGWQWHSSVRDETIAGLLKVDIDGVIHRNQKNRQPASFWRMFMKVAKLGLTMATVAAVAFGAASLASAQQNNSGGTLMQERQGAMGTEKGAGKPAAQGGNLSGSGAPSAEDEAKAATGSTTEGGSLKFGAKGKDGNSLPAERQGTIGTPERPPEPTTQGGAKQ
jgi:hypothetical protein